MLKSLGIEHSEDSSDDFVDQSVQDAALREKERQERLQDAPLMRSSNEYFMHVIIVHKWPRLRAAPRFLPDLAYPPAVFPIFSGLLYTKCLVNSPVADAHFEATLSVITADLAKMPISNREAVLSVLILVLLVRKNQKCYGLDQRKAQTLVNELERLLDQLLMRLLKALWMRGEVVMNRFATAAFECRGLESDFRDLFSGVREEIRMGDIMTKFLLGRFIVLFEHRLLLKLIENQSRFNFQNSMTWSSLLTAVESDEHVSLPLVRQGISALLMAQAISKEPDIIKDVCPGISPELVAFFLQNYKTDMNVKEEIKLAAFRKRHKVQEVLDVKKLVPPCPRIGWAKLIQCVFLQNWCAIARDEEQLQHYDYLLQYARGVNG
jgi:hypothetical protein